MENALALEMRAAELERDRALADALRMRRSMARQMEDMALAQDRGDFSMMFGCASLADLGRQADNLMEQARRANERAELCARLAALP